MKIYDLTRTVYTDMPVYDTDPLVKIQSVMTVQNDGYKLSDLKFGSHTGTHCDAFSHFIADGENIDQMDLQHFFGKALVISVPCENGIIDCEKISDSLEKIRNEKILLIKTGWDKRNFDKGFFENFPCFFEPMGEILQKAGIMTLGIDTPSMEISGEKSAEKAHLDLLGRKIAIIENLMLSEIPDGTYLFSALPLKIKGCDGSPCRAVCVQTD